MKSKIITGDCIKELEILSKKNVKVQGVITSPPYNTSRQADHITAGVRYKNFDDSMPNDDYIQWMVDLFNLLDEVLDKDGAVCFNISYSSLNPGTIWRTISAIIEKTNFITVDHIVWKKSTCMPFPANPNRLSRIVESVFVFVRESEMTTFKTNKKITTTSGTGQNYYEVIENFIEAPNNNSGEHTKHHKATYSTELVDSLIDIYFSEGTILDPFNGTGTTGVSCKSKGLDYIGIEIDEEYSIFSKERIDNQKLGSKKINETLDEW